MQHSRNISHTNKSKAPVSQLVNAEVSSGNRKGILTPNLWTPSALGECIMYKQLNNKLHTHSGSFQYMRHHKGGCVPFFGGFAWLPIDKKASRFSFKNLPFFSCVMLMLNET